MVNDHYTYSTLSESSLYSTSQLTRKEEQTTIVNTNDRLSKVIAKVDNNYEVDDELFSSISTSLDDSIFKFTYEKDLETHYKHDIDTLYSQITRLQLDLAEKKSEHYKLENELKLKTKIYNEEETAYNQIDLEEKLEKIKITELVTKEAYEYNHKLIEDIQALRFEFEQLIHKREKSFFWRFDVDFDIGVFVEKKYHFEETMKELNNTIITKKREIENLKNEIEIRRQKVAHLKTVDIDTIEAEKSARGKIELIRKDRALAEKIEKYIELMDFKLLFDSELSIYQKLVASEETRLVIRQVVDHHTGRSFTTRAHSNIETVFDEVNMQGDYIQLTNKGGIENHLGGYTITSIADRNERSEIVYKFKPDLKLKPGESVKIFSHHDKHHDKHNLHSPHSNIKHLFFEKHEHWPKGNRLDVKLLDENKVIAKLEAWYEKDAE
jgi:hypothetical protein